MGAEPESLYYYDATSYAAGLVLQALYDGPLDTVGYSYRPVILEKLPSLADGDVVIEAVAAKPGDRVVDQRGEVVTLAAGVLIHPSGCRTAECAVPFEGGAMSMDRMRVTFHLKPNLRWSDGTPLTAQDSVYSFELARDPATVKGKWLELRTANYAAQGESTVVWTGIPGFLDRAYPANFWTPLPAHAWRTYKTAELPQQAAVARVPLGYGPYVIDQWTPGDSIRLLPNPHYYRADEGLPYFDEITFRFVNNQNVIQVLDMLENGECDVLTRELYPERSLTRLREMDQAGVAKLYLSTAARWEHLTFNAAPPPDYAAPSFFADVRTRQAAAACINRQRLVDEVQDGLGALSVTYLPTNHPLYAADTSTPHLFDPAHGQALLDEVGWRDANGDGIREAHSIPGIVEGTPFQVLYRIPESVARRSAADLITADLAACGIQVNVETYPPAEFYTSGPGTPMSGRHFDLLSFAWLTQIEPTCSLYATAAIPSDANYWEGDNVAGYTSAEYDAACAQTQAALPDEAAYRAAHREAQRLFSADLPALPLYWYVNVYVARPDLQGFQPEPLMGELWNIEEFKLAADAQ
jgi:peptide/nickel transport system substrate-binding protein